MQQPNLPLKTRHWPVTDYTVVWEAMRAFTDARSAETPDELWVVEHPAVFTQGQAGRPEHIINAHDIPIVLSDRGGQVTYHGPGQLVLYTLLDLKRRDLGIKTLVCQLEQAIIEMLSQWGIIAERQPKAPGVYVNQAKIASLGLRVRRGCSYHGLSLNVDMDLKPFTYIHPCGYADLTVTQLKDLRPMLNLPDVTKALLAAVLSQLGKINDIDENLSPSTMLDRPTSFHKDSP